MIIAILKERRSGERRVAGSLESVKKFIAMGANVFVETDAGLNASISDDMFKTAGANISVDAKSAVKNADIILKVQRPMTNAEGLDEVGYLKSGQVLICILSAISNKDLIADLAKSGVKAFAMELVPRISRAQSMDVLSSQANIAGYKSVLDALNHYGRVAPLMMTAGGTVAPAKIFIMGVGVAGLQAIATAKRLGAIVSATDVRPVTEEQVQSLAAEFVAVKDEEFLNAQTTGGYAKQMSPEYQKKQAELIAKTIAKQDIVITTALIPGRDAPVLVTEDMVKSMKLGSVIVDLAVEAGGNCPISELGKVVVKHGVTIVGHENIPSRVAEATSALYAKNLLNFLTPMISGDDGDIKIDLEDEIIKGTLVCSDGAIVNDMLKDDRGKAKTKKAAVKKTNVKKAAAKKASAKKAAAKKASAKKAAAKKASFKKANIKKPEEKKAK